MLFGMRRCRISLPNRCYLLISRVAHRAIPWWDETTPCYTWLFGSGLPFEWYSRDAVHSGEYGKQIIGRIMLGYFMTGK